MDCDIHLHGEVKIHGKWRHWSTPWIDRDYELFAKMAGVRGDGSIIPVSEPKGIPEDATFETRFDYDIWKPYSHSASWLNRAEIREVEQFLMKRRPHERTTFFFAERYWGYLLDSDWSDSPEHHPIGVEDARFVFWFDQ